LGKLAGETSVNGIVDWIKERQGWLRMREIWTSTQMNNWFETEWAGVAQVFRLRRDVKDGDKEREEIVYGLTNLRRRESERLAPARFPTSPLADRKSLAPTARCHR